MFSYLATSFLGFEAACESEIRQKLKPHSVRIMPQKVYFTSDVLPSRIDNLKSAVRICAWVAEFNDLPPGIDALKRLETYASECDWSKPLQSFYLRHPTIQPTDHQFRVTAERRGLEHKGWKSPEAAGSIGSGVVEQFGWKVNLKNFNTEIFIEIDDTLVTIGIVLFSDLHKRNRVTHNFKTGLNTSFSYCLARVANIQPGDVVIDPLCGVGTVTNEAALEWTNATYFGGDVDTESIEQARINSEFCKAPVSYFNWDATSLPFRVASVDIIFSDLPFGHRHGSTKSNQSLYPKLFAEFHRILKVGGRCLLVTTQKSLIRSILQSHTSQWRQIESYMVDVGGFMAQLYHLEHTTPYVAMSSESLATILSSPKSVHNRHNTKPATSSPVLKPASSAASPQTIFSSMSPAMSGHHGMTMSKPALVSNNAGTVSKSSEESSAQPTGPPPFDLSTASVAPMIAASPALRAAFAPLLAPGAAFSLTGSAMPPSLPPISLPSQSNSSGSNPTRTPLLSGLSPSLTSQSPAQRPALVLSSPSLQHMVSPSLSFVPTFAGRRSNQTSAQPSPALPPHPHEHDASPRKRSRK